MEIEGQKVGRTIPARTRWRRGPHVLLSNMTGTRKLTQAILLVQLATSPFPDTYLGIGPEISAIETRRFTCASGRPVEARNRVRQNGESFARDNAGRRESFSGFVMMYIAWIWSPLESNVSTEWGTPSR